MKKNLLFFVVMMALNLLAFGQSDKKVATYMRTWGLGSTQEEIDKGKHWTAEDVKGNELSSLIIAFAHIENGTDVVVQDMDSTKPNPFLNLPIEIKKLKKSYPHLKVNLSVGGWGADGFSDMALTKDSRTKFIESLIKNIKTFDFDGIDIDWEYPVNGGWGTIKSRPEDKVNFTSLMKEIREALDKLGKETKKVYGLSFAAAAGGWYFDCVELKELVKVVDYVKLMTYDYYGGWSETTGHLSSLYDNGKNEISTDAVVKAYIQQGVPKEKLMMGVPLYGRAWKGVKDGGTNGLYQAQGGDVYPDGVTQEDIASLIASGYKRYWDNTAKVPYLYNGDVFVTYEDSESLKEKAKYVKDNGLAGIMVWEYAHDIKADLFKVIKENLK